MTVALRMGTRRDYHTLVKVRAEWLDRFCGAHPAGERWCPANAPVPWIEDEARLLKHLPRKEGDCWAAVSASQREADAYILCQADQGKGELSIWRNNPRVSPRVELSKVGSKLIEFAIRKAHEEGLQRVCVSLHGFPDEVDPLIDLYRKHGFEGQPRLEMVSRQLHIHLGPQRLQFRSAEEIGLDALYEIDAAIHNRSVEQLRTED